MSSKNKHQKHPPIKRPLIGEYHRNEWSILGTNCSRIKDFFLNIQYYLSPRFNLLFVDADHKEGSKNDLLQKAEKQFISELYERWNTYDDKLIASDYNAVFINGNHYPASRQIIILDPEKKNSLYRRLEYLSDIFLIIKLEEEQEIYDFLEDKITADTPIFNIRDETNWKRLFRQSLERSIPPLKALILAGGNSIRMGFDKSQIEYFKGRSIELYLAELCQKLNLEAFISKGNDFSEQMISNFPVIRDKLTGMGPFGAIISAFIRDPEAAWLVIACDLPFIKKSLLKDLITIRNFTKIATAVKAKSKDFPEPLIAIYEPHAKKRFFDFLTLGYNCPRKVLINSDIEILEIEDQSIIENVNTPDEKNSAMDKIQQMDG